MSLETYYPIEKMNRFPILYITNEKLNVCLASNKLFTIGSLLFYRIIEYETGKHDLNSGKNLAKNSCNEIENKLCINKT